MIEWLRRDFERVPRTVVDIERDLAAIATAGGAELPGPVRALMRQTARIMTGTAYWV